MQVENAFLAPTILLACKGRWVEQQSCGRLDSVCVDLRRRQQNLAEVMSGRDIKVVRSENYTTTVYSGEMRSEIVEEAFNYLREGANKYFDEDESLEISSQDDGVQVGDNTFAPARYGRPVKFYELENPFSQCFPMFFPSCTGDVDYPREMEISDAPKNKKCLTDLAQI